MKEVIYTKYSNMRAPRFQIKTVILCDESGEKYVEKHALTDCAVEHIQRLAIHGQRLNKYANGTKFVFNKCKLHETYVEFEYIEGKRLSEIISQKVKQNDANAVKGLIRSFYDQLCAMAVEPFKSCEELEQIFGKLNFSDVKMACPITDIDMIFDNVIVDNEIWNVLDYEWTFNFAIPIEYVMYRTVICAEPLFSSMFCAKEVFDYLGFSDEDLMQYDLMEKRFGEYVKSGSEDLWKLRDMKERMAVGELLNAHAAQLQNNEQVKLREEHVQKLSAAIDEKEHHIQKQNALLEETMQNYRHLEDSYRNDIAAFNQQLSDVQRQYAQEQLNMSRELTQAVQKMGELVDKHARLSEEKCFHEQEEQRLKQEKMVLEQEKECLEQEKKSLTAEKELLANEKNAVEDELATYKEHYLLAISQRNDLQAKLIVAQSNYDAISNATFWKITKPLRSFTNGVKNLLRANRYTRLIGKGVMSLLKHGVSETWEKVKRKLKNRHQTLVTTPVDESPKENVVQEKRLQENIKFSVLVPLYNTPEKYLREMIQSVLNQTYSNWELCLADGSDSAHGSVESVCQEYALKDNRIRYHRLTENKGISENTNACAKLATGDYIALLDHDDVYAPDALRCNAKAIQETDADVLYSDEDHLALDGTHINPFYKPDWSPDLLYSQMYICHLLVFRKSLFQKIGGYRSEFDGSQDYDLMLRFSEETNRICHIPRVLYSWRESENSTAANADAKPYAHIAGKNALNDHLKRKYGEQAYAEESEYMFVFNPRFGLIEKPLVSIIIPMKDHWEMTDACIKSIFEKSTYPNYEILVLDNRSEKEDTFKWFAEIQKDERIRVIDANMEFNWSKLNNYGISYARGDVFVFLNNDTLVISEDWLEHLVENAQRPDIGVVGGLLLYEDNTIQHAGVVVGIGGWADHIFKGMKPVHYGAPYVSPMVSRNVLAVTGACMAVSRKTLERIGPFDEEFVICGSDIELCIRAHDYGLFNRYDVNVRLYHLESKSRDSYIPDVDFKKSYETYAPYRENIDPYFNINLDTSSVIPKEKVAPMNLVNFKNFLKRCPLTAGAYKAVRTALMAPADYTVPEIGALVPRKAEQQLQGKRLNLLVPSIDKIHVFGGISTAIKFYEEMVQQGNYSSRIIVLDAPVCQESSVLPKEYVLVNADEEQTAIRQVLPMADRYGKTFPVAEKDVFVATSWWSAYVINEVLHWQREVYGKVNPMVYFIQDYEPGFYPWSSRYMMADSTYRSELPIYAVLNSKLLYDHFEEKGYKFTEKWYFEPTLNESLKQYLPAQGTVIPKKKQVLVYGRPSTARNAFELLVYGLREWVEKQENIDEWEIFSAGEQHDDVDLGKGVVLHSVGKLSLQEYAQMMLDTYAGVSLMVSPHPSYPPLEMATFGAKTITNCYESKDLTSFSENMICLKSCAPRDIAKALLNVCNNYDGSGIVNVQESYLEIKGGFGEIPSELCAKLSEC